MPNPDNGPNINLQVAIQTADRINHNLEDIPNWDAAIVAALKLYGYALTDKNNPMNFLLEDPATLEDAFKVLGTAAALLLKSKQAKYGKDNIREFGHYGLVIRSNDKLQRLKNKYFKNVDLGEEGVIESYGDLVGYGILGIALEKGWFDLPLTKDMVFADGCSK